MKSFFWFGSSKKLLVQEPDASSEILVSIKTGYDVHGQLWFQRCVNIRKTQQS